MNDKANPSKENTHDRFQLTVDDHGLVTADPVLTGRQILDLAAKRPVDEHLVYWLMPDNVLEDIGLDESVDLRQPGVERFITFRSDRSFRFEIAGKRQDWGAPAISEATIRKIAGAPTHVRVWIEQTGEADRIIDRNEMIDLTAPGIERFYFADITLVNEDNGHEYPLVADKDTPIQALIAEIYSLLKVERKPDDRLRCEAGGGDVFTHAGLTFGKYLEAGHCTGLVWLFAGGTGGASCRS